MTSPGNNGPPPLRLKGFAIENFRTFRERVELELEPDVTVFHGETGSGKSTALAAMDLFFRSVAALSRGTSALVGMGVRLPWSAPDGAFREGGAARLLSERDRPSATTPTILGAAFSGSENPVEIQFEPHGDGVSLAWRRPPAANDAAGDLFQRFFPFGSASRPLGILDARRRPRWIVEEAGSSLLTSTLARELYALRTSRIAADRERWRSFASTVSSFPTLRGATVEIEAPREGQTAPELVIEHPGRAVLTLDELSSGEQELVALTAGLLLARSAIVAIEEPEMGLDAATQELWKQVCNAQRAAGLVHQVIYESHAVTFDGPRVVRFRRDKDGATRVESSAAPSDAKSAEARAKGAEETYVTRDGFTQLPEPMRKDIRLGENGAHVWFLRGKDAWEAWPEDKLEEVLAEKPR